MNIRDLITDYLAVDGASVSQLASDVGVHRNAIGAYRSGARDPSAPTMVRLLDAIKASPEQRADVFSTSWDVHPSQLARIVGAV